MKKDNQVFLKHILDSINAIEDHTQNMTYEILFKSKWDQDALYRNLEIIGEAAKNIEEF